MIEQHKMHEMTVPEFLIWFEDYARENHKGDKGLAMLELELQGFLD